MTSLKDKLLELTLIKGMQCIQYLRVVFVVLPARLPWSPSCCLLQTPPLSQLVGRFLEVRSLLVGPQLCPAGALADPGPGLRDRPLPPLLVLHHLPQVHQGPRHASEWWLVSSRLHMKGKTTHSVAYTQLFVAFWACHSVLLISKRLVFIYNISSLIHI